MYVYFFIFSMKNNLWTSPNSGPEIKTPLHYVQLWEYISHKAEIDSEYNGLMHAIHWYIDERHGFNMLLPDEYKNPELALPRNDIVTTLKEKYNGKLLQSFDSYLKDRVQSSDNSDKKFKDIINDIRKHPELLHILELMQEGMKVINNAKNIDEAYTWIHILDIARGKIDPLIVEAWIRLN